MAVNREFFLKDKYEQYQIPEVVRTEALYENISNRYLKSLFAILQQEFNRLFKFMYGKSNGHYNAEESRQLIEYIKLYEDMEFVLKESDYSFKINENYKKLIEKCKTFLQNSGGSAIPNDLEQIRLLEYEPIFTMVRNIKIVRNVDERNYPINLIGEGSYAFGFSN